RRRGSAAARAPRPAVVVDRLHEHGVVAVRLVGGEQVSEHHGAGQVRDVLLADHPATLGLPDNYVLVLITVRTVITHTFPCLPTQRPRGSDKATRVTAQPVIASTAKFTGGRGEAGLRSDK